MPNPDPRIEIQKALEAATKGAEWTNFDDVKCEEGKVVAEYDRVTESMGRFIVECQSVEIAHLIANAPEWLRYLLKQNEQQQAELERTYDLYAKLQDSFDKLDTDAANDYEQLQHVLGERDEWLRKAGENGKFYMDALKELEQVKAERDDYRKVLEWYGEDEHWHKQYQPEGIAKFRAVVDGDKGERARDILSRYKERGESQSERD